MGGFMLTPKADNPAHCTVEYITVADPKVAHVITYITVSHACIGVASGICGQHGDVRAAKVFQERDPTGDGDQGHDAVSVRLRFDHTAYIR